VAIIRTALAELHVPAFACLIGVLSGLLNNFSDFLAYARIELKIKHRFFTYRLILIQGFQRTSGQRVFDTGSTEHFSG